jgi:hypothetical protein
MYTVTASTTNKVLSSTRTALCSLVFTGTSTRCHDES